LILFRDQSFASEEQKGSLPSHRVAVRTMRDAPPLWKQYFGLSSFSILNETSKKHSVYYTLSFELLFLNENKNFSLTQLSHIFRQETLLFSFRKSGFREVLSAR
jgi:hypothetical protein